jgi:hypothetical protein
MKTNSRYLFIITILYFTLPFISIIAAISAVLCIGLPFVLYSKENKNVWCKSYCPRSSFFMVVGRKRDHYKMVPSIFTNGKLQSILLVYLTLNLIFISGSTLQVAMQNMEMMPYLRLFIVVKLFPIPQLLSLPLPFWLIHLSYRLYSMMLSSTLLGVAFALLYRQRAWCTVCPINSVITKLNEEYS